LPTISPKSLSLSQSQKRESPFKETGGRGIFPSRPSSFWPGFASQPGAKPQKSTSKSLIADILHSNPFTFKGLQLALDWLSD
jgi:hypothetical protein